LIHGLLGWGDQDLIDKNNIIPYWGMGPVNLVPHLKKLGYEVYNPSFRSANTSNIMRRCSTGTAVSRTGEKNEQKNSDCRNFYITCKK